MSLILQRRVHSSDLAVRSARVREVTVRAAGRSKSDARRHAHPSPVVALEIAQKCKIYKIPLTVRIGRDTLVGMDLSRSMNNPPLHGGSVGLAPRSGNGRRALISGAGSVKRRVIRSHTRGEERWSRISALLEGVSPDRARSGPAAGLVPDRFLILGQGSDVDSGTYRTGHYGLAVVRDGVFHPEAATEAPPRVAAPRPRKHLRPRGWESRSRGDSPVQRRIICQPQRPRAAFNSPVSGRHPGRHCRSGRRPRITEGRAAIIGHQFDKLVHELLAPRRPWYQLPWSGIGPDDKPVTSDLDRDVMGPSTELDLVDRSRPLEADLLPTSDRRHDEVRDLAFLDCRCGEVRPW